MIKTVSVIAVFKANLMVFWTFFCDIGNCCIGNSPLSTRNSELINNPNISSHVKRLALKHEQLKIEHILIYDETDPIFKKNVTCLQW